MNAREFTEAERAKVGQADPYVPVDTSQQARDSWPTSDYAGSFPELNARAMGQRLTGELSGRCLHGERAHMLTIDEGRMAGIVATLVENGWCVARDRWDGLGTQVTLAVWSGL